MQITSEEFEGDGVRCGRVDISHRAALLSKFGAVLAGAALISAVAMLPEGGG